LAISGCAYKDSNIHIFLVDNSHTNGRVRYLYTQEIYIDVELSTVCAVLTPL
jgi:hypothetical protein